MKKTVAILLTACAVLLALAVPAFADRDRMAGTGIMGTQATDVTK